MRDPRKFSTVDEYIRLQTTKVSSLLKQLRESVKSAAPEAEEGISYNMPAYKLHGALVYFAAFDHHIGFYPTPSAIEAFRADLSKYPVSKGGIRFAFDEPLPLSLIKKMVKFRVKENLDKAKEKAALKKLKKS